MSSVNPLQSASLLIEFLTEELPPKALNTNIGEAFSIALQSELKTYLTHGSKVSTYITPRRFACLITNVHNQQLEQVHKRKGPSIANALSDGVPNNALLGFMRSCKIDNINDLEQASDGYFYANKVVAGELLQDNLAPAINNALKQLIIDKNMRWGNNEHSFVRPVRNILISYNNLPIASELNIFGLKPNTHTFGHRFINNNQPININDADNYSNILEEQGLVIASWDKRYALILGQLNQLSDTHNLQLIDNPELLNEVCAIVEYPVVLVGEFLSEFLSVPKECLILSMAKNQKYFATLDIQTKQLSNKFLFVANLKSTDPELIIQGNQKVLNARLSDAQFFFNLDINGSFSQFNDKLKDVVYHKKLGSMGQRVERIKQIALLIGQLYKVNSNLITEAANLLKTDLSSNMVGEFPELQGIMGKYYALNWGYTNEVAQSVAEHYLPRFSGDSLPDEGCPQKRLATVMALSDKLETIVGIWGIGLAPTGEKDQYALRRAALGVVRILMRDHISLPKLIELSLESFTQYNFAPTIRGEISQFIKTRLYNYLISLKYPTHQVQSITSIDLEYFDYLPELLDSLKDFLKSSLNQTLIASNKRIENILKKYPLIPSNSINPKLLQLAEEIKLYEVTQKVHNQASLADISKNWQGFFSLLSCLNAPINDFFDKVLIMDKDLALKNNRIALLDFLYKTLNKHFKLSMLES